MKYSKSMLIVLLTLFVVYGLALPLEEASNEMQKLDNSGLTGCREECGDNKRCDGLKCVCEIGFHEGDSPDSEDCEMNICEPSCDNDTQICEGSQCICKAGYHNDGVPGAPNCAMPTKRTTTPETSTASFAITTTTSHTTHNTTITHLPTTHSTTTTHSHPTHNTTTTTTKPSTTTSKPTPKPTHKPHKSAMSPWTITAIIFLVAGLAGLGGFIIYRYKNRGSYRTAGGQ